MSFRIEEKIDDLKKFLIRFKKFIFAKNAKLLYPKRIINSLYFDNENYQMYDDSIEGLVQEKIKLDIIQTKKFLPRIENF